MDLRPPIAGLVGAAFGLGVAELTAGVLPAGRSPVASTGDMVIRNVPPGIEQWAIRTFGTNDKVVLVVGTIVVVLALGALAGELARWPKAAVAIGTLAVGVGVVAAIGHPEANGLSAVPPLVGGLGSLAAVTTLVRVGRDEPVGPLRPSAMGRRAFVITGAATALAAPLTAAVGRRLQQRVDAAASRARAAVERGSVYGSGGVAVGGADLGIDGVAPFITPNNDFYRIDTALVVPQVEAETWSMRIHGRVDRELRLTYDELLARRTVERAITLACVSNEIGGDLIGNAVWTGVPLADLLAEVGVEPGADQVVGRSIDGFTAGFPVSAALDGRDALVAFGMNGEPLPVRHGFPVRLVVPGLYGYVSATKWLSEIELTRFDDFNAYWIRLNWALPAPISVQSRIDVPGRRVEAGQVNVAGVAWAQGRGIGRVEVRVDDGRWHDAELAEAPSVDTWRQWRWRWDAEPGRHRLSVRATDGAGEVQTAERMRPFPGPANGWHQHTVEVT